MSWLSSSSGVLSFIFVKKWLRLLVGLVETVALLLKDIIFLQIASERPLT
jgi:hypothetical protein